MTRGERESNDSAAMSMHFDHIYALKHDSENGNMFLSSLNSHYTEEKYRIET